MSFKQARPMAGMILAVLLLAAASQAEVHITLPRRTKPTPVQKLNRDGVKEIQKHNYEKAKKYFYRAYLIDPDDPFTLNNLGYISELEGNIDRAERYYALAADHTSDAQIDMSSSTDAKGKSVSQVAGNANDRTLLINRDNVQAIGLLQKDRAPEADLLLTKALALDPKNPFTLNNLGFAKEKEGELEQALSYYSSAAALGSNETIVVTVNRGWRGKPISQIASDNADKVRKQMRKEETPESKVARLNLRGVSAMNRNDRQEAREYFQQAYKVAPENAFTLNNMGYLAEMDGDKETADFYYAKAQEARQRDAKVGVSTRKDMEGQKLAAVANTSDQEVQNRIQADLARKRQQGGPIELKRRDNTPVIEPTTPPPATPQAENGPNPQSPQEQPIPQPPSEARPEPAPLGPDLNQPPRPATGPESTPTQPIPPATTAPGTQPQTVPQQGPYSEPQGPYTQPQAPQSQPAYPRPPVTQPQSTPPTTTAPTTPPTTSNPSTSAPTQSQPENGIQPPR